MTSVEATEETKVLELFQEGVCECEEQHAWVCCKEGPGIEVQRHIHTEMVRLWDTECMMAPPRQCSPRGRGRVKIAICEILIKG